MKSLHIIALAIIGIIMVPQTSMAQNSRALEQISDINRINPLQNPEFDRDTKIVNRKIIDRKNKVVGRVSDVIVNSNGTIASIITDFDRLRLGDDIALNYRNLNIRGRSDSYVLSMDADEIRDFYPQLLSGIETASGDGNSSFSVRKIAGAQLVAKDGRKIGKVKNVLFSNNGGIVRALYADLTYGKARGDTVAVPFRNVKFSTQKGRLKGTIDNDIADAMLQIADD